MITIMEISRTSYFLTEMCNIADKPAFFGKKNQIFDEPRLIGQKICPQ